MVSAKFSQLKMNELRKFNWREFKDEELRRSFMRAITLLGDSGISDLDKLNKWKRTKAEMNRIFSTAKIKLDNKIIDNWSGNNFWLKLKKANCL